MPASDSDSLLHLQFRANNLRNFFCFHGQFPQYIARSNVKSAKMEIVIHGQLPVH